MKCAGRIKLIKLVTRRDLSTFEIDQSAECLSYSGTSRCEQFFCIFLSDPRPISGFGHFEDSRPRFERFFRSMSYFKDWAWHIQ